MAIQLTPVRVQFHGNAVEHRDVLRVPFPYMRGRQAVFSCAREALFYGIRLFSHIPVRAHVPAYCCKSVLSPFERLGIEVIFYDVSKNFEPVLDKTKFEQGDIFLLIHYFGLPQDVIFFNKICKEYGMALAEDCAHTLPDPGAKYPMGSTGTFSIYSLRKQLPVPDGGVLIVNDQVMGERLAGHMPPALRNVPFKRWLVTTLDRFSFAFGWPNVLILKDKLRNFMGSGDSIFNRQLRNDARPEISAVTARILNNTNIKTIAGVRRRNYCFMADKLSGTQGVTVPFPLLPEGAVPQAFPVLLESPEQVCAVLRRKGIGAGLWPDYELPENIKWADFPGALTWVKSLLILPLHQDLNRGNMESIIRELKKALLKG